MGHLTRPLGVLRSAAYPGLETRPNNTDAVALSGLHPSRLVCGTAFAAIELSALIAQTSTMQQIIPSAQQLQIFLFRSPSPAALGEAP